MLVYFSRLDIAAGPIVNSSCVFGNSMGDLYVIIQSPRTLMRTQLLSFPLDYVFCSYLLREDPL
jgi:hypothetical protein